MLKHFVKRCIASLLIIIICGGCILPATTVLADKAKGESIKITSKISAQLYTVEQYYRKDNPRAESTSVELIKIINSKDKMETFGWASKFVFGMSGKTFTFKSDWAELDGDLADSYTNTVLSAIDSSLGVDVDSTNIFERLYELGDSQGASNADLTNINQRFAALLYMRLNPDNFKDGSYYRWDSVSDIDDSDYADMLNSTLEIEHDKTLSNYLSDFEGISDVGEIDTGETWTNSDSSVLNPDVLGVMAMDTQDETFAGTNNRDVDSNRNNRAYSINNSVFIANEAALYACIYEYLDWYTDEMPEIVKDASWVEDASVKSALTYLRIFDSAFSQLVPLVDRIYTMKNPNADNMSIEDMVERSGASDTTIKDAFDVDISTYTEHKDNTTPVTQFYTVNSTIGITGYNRDEVLNDIEVDTRLDEEAQEELEQERNDEAITGENHNEVSNSFLLSQRSVAQEMLKYLDDSSKKNDLLKLCQSGRADTLLDVLKKATSQAWSDSVEDSISNGYASSLYRYFTDGVVDIIQSIADGDTETVLNYLNEQAEETGESFDEITDNLVDFGVDENGTASSYASVTINSYLIQGMAYSTTYIPMRTNLYAPETIKQFKGDDEDNEFYNFYVDYGFMRKALYMDTSATAVSDFYNANGTFTGSLKVCTLRDLIESSDNDIALYIDSNFYNAAEAIDEGNQLLEATRESRESLYTSLTEFAAIWKNANWLTNNAETIVSSLSSIELKNAVLGLVGSEDAEDDKVKIDVEELREEYKDAMLSSYKFDIDKFSDSDVMSTYAENLAYANSTSATQKLSEQVLKTNGYTSYSSSLRALLAEVGNSDYVNLSNDEDGGSFSIDVSDNTINTDDNMDTLVLTSSQINQYISGEMTYKQTSVDEDAGTETTNSYTSDTGYSPMLSLAYVSCLYRDSNMYTLANTVESNNPVFMASDDLCGIEEANQWYRNTLINYALLKNLKGNAQVDVTYVTDLDCPVYMDIFGNILTESGIVVIPAASNATLHVGSFKNYNYSSGLYSCYGKEYTIPADLEGALSVLYPYFVIDENAKEYVINGITMNVDSTAVRFDKIDTYSEDTRDALMNAYKAAVSSGASTRLNWIATVKIANEVMRGAPIEDIDKNTENLYVNQTKSGLVAAAKLESMLESLHGKMANTLLYIPDFSRTDNLEVWVALFIKLMMVALAAVVIISIYRDGVSGQLGPKTILQSVVAIALTVSCVVAVPTVFQITYYSANKFLLEDEAMRILMVNEEKRQGGVEIGITKQNTVSSNGEFALQLDWVSVPWYEELENILYDSTLENLQEVKLEAYRETAIYNNSDVTMYNDGAYVTTDDLFDSVSMDYTFNTSGNTRGLYLYANGNQPQTASFYSPYYVFLRVLTANVNEYNRWLNNAGDKYVNEEEATSDADTGTSGVLGSYNYTVKYMSENRPKTVGLCEAYFTSDDFMTYDEDIMRLCQIYGSISTDQNPATAMISEHESGFNRASLFSSSELEQFRASYWYNYDIVDVDMYVYNNIGKTDKFSKSEKRQMYVEEHLEDFYSRVDAMDNYARDFIAENKDMIGKVSDETFIKVMALSLSIKYNQLFGVPSANSLEIYNMDSEDLIRLCIVPSEEAVMATSMSYPRFVYTFGGEAGVYVAAVLSIIMWLGSFIKPLCTIIVFISVFMSIFIFRVVLRKPSANLWGYIVTILLLCATNLLHALLLKIGVSLPDIGLSALGCLIFLIVGQIVYLLVLAYVTGVSLKDWSNLGASEYEKEARLLKSKLGKDNTSELLNGKIKHHENNWDYYNDLVDQHRSRNKT